MDNCASHNFAVPDDLQGILTIYNLPAGTTGKLQPLDQVTFQDQIISFSSPELILLLNFQGVIATIKKNYRSFLLQDMLNAIPK